MNDADALQPADLLSPADRAAIDALVEANFDLQQVPAAHRDRAIAIERLLRNLNLPASHFTADQLAALLAVTLDRVVAATPGVTESFALSPADDDALEALVQAGFDPRRVASGMRDRAGAQLALLQNLDAGLSVATAQPDLSFARESLVQRTLTRVAEVRTQQAASATTLDRPRGRWSAFRFADLMTAAAVLLIGSAIMWPVMGSVRERSRQASCQAGLGGIGGAMSQYATDNRDALPLASASLAGTPWWFVGDPQRSNSANFFKLRHDAYADLQQMTCAGNRWSAAALPDDARDWTDIAHVSYSYQNMFAKQRTNYNSGPAMVVVTDRSPVVLKAIRGEWIDPMENSPNHRGAGQQMLRLDRSVIWTTSPVLPNTRENVWLPRDLEDAIRAVKQIEAARRREPLKGVEAPAAPDDVFVGP